MSTECENLLQIILFYASCVIGLCIFFKDVFFILHISDRPMYICNIMYVILVCTIIQCIILCIFFKDVFFILHISDRPMYICM